MIDFQSILLTSQFRENGDSNVRSGVVTNGARDALSCVLFNSCDSWIVFIPNEEKRSTNYTKYTNHYDRRSNSLRIIDGSSRAVWVMLPVVKRFAKRPKSVSACAE